MIKTAFRMKFFLFVFALIYSLNSTAEVILGDGISTECKQDKKLKYTFCITKTEGSRNADVLYFFHGMRSNPKAWIQKGYGKQIRKIWRDSGFDAPTVIAVSFGKTWFLTEKNTSKKSGLFEVFLDKVMPAIEASLGGVRGQRKIIGESMGGLNATQLFLKKPALFEKIAMVCPVIPSISPFSSHEDVMAYIKRTGASPFFVGMALNVVKEYWPTEADWETANPLKLGQDLLNENTPAFYMSSGRYDEYGAFEGATLFAELAKNKGVRTVEWEPMNGRHCEGSIDPAALARFLSF